MGGGVHTNKKCWYLNKISKLKKKIVMQVHSYFPLRKARVDVSFVRSTF